MKIQTRSALGQGKNREKNFQRLLYRFSQIFCFKKQAISAKLKIKSVFPYTVKESRVYGKRTSFGTCSTTVGSYLLIGKLLP